MNESCGIKTAAVHNRAFAASARQQSRCHHPRRRGDDKIPETVV